MTDIEIIKAANDALAEKLGSDIKVIDISKVSVMCDYFIIATGSNDLQMEALCSNVEEKVKELTGKLPIREGRGSGSWVLLDYGFFIVHIFNQESREFYNLDHIWNDGEIVEF